MITTVGIWVWADLALDDNLSGVPATIYVNEQAHPNLWVSFDEQAVARVKLTLSGTRSKIAELSRELKDPSRKLDFYFDAVAEGM